MRQTASQYRERQDALALNPPLTWIDGDNEYYRITTCKRYSICKIVLPHGLIYEAWHGKEKLSYRGPVKSDDYNGRRIAAHNLELVCQAHAEKQR